MGKHRELYSENAREDPLRFMINWKHFEEIKDKIYIFQLEHPDVMVPYAFWGFHSPYSDDSFNKQMKKLMNTSEPHMKTHEAYRNSDKFKLPLDYTIEFTEKYPEFKKLIIWLDEL